MDDPTDPRRPDEHPRDRSSTPVPSLVRRVSRPFGRRHVKGVAAIRWIVAIWLTILAAIFCALGQWWGVSLIAVAILVGWLAYQMPRYAPMLDALQNERRPR